MANELNEILTMLQGLDERIVALETYKPADKELLPPPLPPAVGYFADAAHFGDEVSDVLTLLGRRIDERGGTYNRAYWYKDIAWLIRHGVVRAWPFIDGSENNWLIWADECDVHGDELGADRQYNMTLPIPTSDALEYTNALDLLFRYMVDSIKTEIGDSQIDTSGPLTVAECIKVTERLARRLKMWCYTPVKWGNHGTRHVPWPWLEFVQQEMLTLYKGMGEPQAAGDFGVAPGGGPIGPQPFSWPGG